MSTKDFLTPDPALAPGTRHAGFTVTSAEPLPELSGTAYLMRHDATGARALWLATDDVNKSFSITFKTPPADDTGVFHILEHSVLCGSERYPVKEPFVNLLKTSMQTFLNAMTFPDKTMYPVASTNTADLENLMGVYLDAVLHPAIYERPRIFEQEGWHLEPAGEKGEALAYNGVVLNEMKGALSDPDDVLYQAVSRALFPDTAYGFESGGNPRAIPTLTYEDFLDTHARHYALSNSYTVLYGDLDIDRELAFIDERFAGADERGAGAPNPLELQAPVRPERRQVEMATAPGNAAVGVGYVIGTAADRERLLATDVLMDALCGSNEAPLKRRILDAGLADDFNVMLADGMLQPFVLFQLKGLHGADAGARFRALLEEACAELAETGIGRDKLAASLAQAEFNLRERDFGSYPDGVALSMQVMSGWLYDDGAALDYLRYEDALAHLKAGLDDGYFERLLRELVCESAHAAEVELVPVEEGSAREEEAELARRRAEMTDDELAAVAEEVAALRAEQEAPDSPEALATLPVLTVDDVEPPATEPRAAADDAAPLPCLAHELDTHGIDYVYHYFDLRCLAFEDLPYVGVLTDLLGRLDTTRHSASDLDTLIEQNLGSLDFFCETYTRDDDLLFADPKLVVGASALSENVGALATLPSEVWGQTLFADTARIRDVLTQRKVALEQYFTGAGHAAAAARANAYFSAAAVVAGQISGVDYYLFLRDLLAHWDERAGALAERLADVARRVFVANDVVASFVGTAEDRARFWEAGGTLGLSAGAGARRLVVPAPVVRNEAFVIPSDVCYVVRGAAPSPADTGTPGAWQVATRALSYDYLWNEVRVKGGAYGVGFKRTTEGLRAFWSYRDPSMDATLARYDGAAAWLASWEPSEEEFGGYVVSAVAAHDAPVKPRQLARRQDSMRFGGRTEGWRDEVRAQELAATADDVRALAAALADGSCPSGVCVFGGRDALQASGVAFDSVTELVGA